MSRAFGIAFAALALLPNASSAQPYDDPAVAACEFILWKGEAQPEGYSRSSAAVDGLKVTIDYTMRVLNVEPRARQHTCLYKVDADGNFTHDLPEPTDVSECRNKLNAIKGRMIQMSATERATAIKDIEACEGVITAFATRRLQELTQIYMPLSEMDLMTIRAEETSLSAGEG